MEKEDKTDENTNKTQTHPIAEEVYYRLLVRLLFSWVMLFFVGSIGITEEHQINND